MKPLGKRVVIPNSVKEHLKKTHEEKGIPEGKWESMKRVKEKKAKKEKKTK